MSPRLIPIERVALLHAVEFFDRVPSHLLAAVAAMAEEVEVATGDALMRQGDHGDCLYVIARGRVRIDENGRTIAELASGDVVGELAALSPGPRNASAIALEPGLFLRVGADVLDELLLDHPDAARSVIDVLVRRLRPSERD